MFIHDLFTHKDIHSHSFIIGFYLTFFYTKFYKSMQNYAKKGNIHYISFQ